MNSPKSESLIHIAKRIDVPCDAVFVDLKERNDGIYGKSEDNADYLPLFFGSSVSSKLLEYEGKADESGRRGARECYPSHRTPCCSMVVVIERARWCWATMLVDWGAVRTAHCNRVGIDRRDVWTVVGKVFVGYKQNLLRWRLDRRDWHGKQALLILYTNPSARYCLFLALLRHSIRGIARWLCLSTA